MFLTREQRYERYAAWCKMLGVEPASFDSWEYESKKIPEVHVSYSHTTSVGQQRSFA